jgi:hypothetical protein
MNNTGQYNRRITHYRHGAETPDGMGGFIFADPTVTEVWCRARQLSMGQKFNYGLESGTVTYDFRFKYLTAEGFLFVDWFVYEGSKFIISEITNLGDKDQEISIIARKDTTANG